MPDHETAPTFDLQSHSTYSDGDARTRGSRGTREQRAWRCSRSPITTPSTASTRQLSAAGDIRLIPAVELSSVHGTLRGPAHPRLRDRSHRPDAARHARRLPRRTASAASTRWPTSCARSASRSTPSGCEHDVARPPAPRGRAARGQRPQPDQERDLRASTSSRARRPTSGARGPRSSRRSRSSTPPAASPCGHTRTGTSSRPSAPLREFAAYGLDGVEAFYITHTEEQTRQLHALARELGPDHDRARPTSTGPRMTTSIAFAPSTCTAWNPTSAASSTIDGHLRRRTLPQPVPALARPPGLDLRARDAVARADDRVRRGAVDRGRVAEHDLAHELARRGRPRAGSSPRACRARRPRRRPPARPSRTGRCRRP